MIRNLIAIVALSLTAISVTSGQLNPIQGHGAPSGSCSGPYMDIDTGNFYTCKLGQFILTSSVASTVIDVAAQFGIKADGVNLIDVTGTNGQATLSSASANFQQSDAGKTALLFDAGGGACVTFGVTLNPIGRLPAGTTILSVQDAHHLTLSQNVTGGAGANMCFEYGTNNTTAAAALKAAVVALTAHDKCPYINYPNGDALFDTPDITINVQPTPCANNPAVSGGTVIGGGMIINGNGMRVIWTHQFWANLNAGLNCSNGGFGTFCHYEPPNAVWKDIIFEGLGESRNGSTDPTKALIGQGSFSIMERVRCEQGGWQDGGILYGYYSTPTTTGATGGEIYRHHVGNDGCGSQAGNNGVSPSAGGAIYDDHGSMQSTCGAGYTFSSFNSGGSATTAFSSYMNYLSRNCTTAGLQVTRMTGGYLHSKGDVWMTEAAVANTMFSCNNGSGPNIWTIEEGHVGVSNTGQPSNVPAGSISIQNASSCIGYLKNSYLQSGTAGATTLNNSGIIYDEGGNAIICTAGCTFGTIIPIGGGSMANTVQIASRNTTLAATNLLGWISFDGTVKTTTMYPVALKIVVAASQSVVGAGCSTNTVITWTGNWTDQTGTAQSATVLTQTIVNNGALAGSVVSGQFPVNTNFGSAITITATVAAGTCTTVPSFAGAASLQ